MFNQFSSVKSLCLAILMWSMSMLISLAQDPVYTLISEEEGLPSNDVYDLQMDDEGFMWIATENGVCRYDGSIFTNFNVEDGLPVNSILKLYKDLHGRMWFLGYNSMLSYYEENVITEYAFNDQLLRYFSDSYIRTILLDSAGNLLLSPRHGSYGLISSEGYLDTDQSEIPRRADSCYLKFEDRGDEHFLTMLNSKPENCIRNGRLLYRGDEYYIKVPYSSREFQRHYVKTSKGNYLVSYRNCVYSINDNKLKFVRSFDEEVIALFLDNKNDLWISLKYDGGIYKFSASDIENQGTHYFRGFTISAITQDREGDYWLGVEGRGIFFVPSFDFNSHRIPGNNRNLNVVALEVSGDRIWLSSRNKSLFTGRLSRGKVSNLREVPIDEPYDWIKHIIVDANGYLWLSSTPGLKYDPAGFSMSIDTIMNSTFLAKGLNDTIIVASRKLGIYHEDSLIFLTDPDSTRRVYSGYHDRNGEIWLGTLYGLYTFKNQKAYFKGNISPYLQERISCIDKMNDLMVIGTTAHGLLFLREDSIVHHLTTANGLLGNSVKSLYIQNDSIAWVGSRIGLSKLIYNNTRNDFRVEGYGHSDGLPSSEINSIRMHEEFVWLGTGRGLVSFDPRKLKPHTVPPRIHISSVRIMGKDTCILGSYDLAHDQNSIRIDFKGLTYRNDEELRYRYRLSNYQDEITETKNKWVLFPNLPPGQYTFFVNVGNVHGVWNDAPVRINFQIRKHFTQSVWFIVLLIIASSATVLLVTKFFQRQKKTKENARNELLKLEQKLFRLQMNPHFVFNALLAIQGYMYMNKPKEAGRYLTSFAKMIRHTLYGSSEEYISLDKEIEALQYYLELQKLRFNDHFDFSVRLEDDIIPESTLVPPLLLQPFLENAIEHGLQHKKEKGVLKLRMKLEAECLRVEIEDDGIGREESSRLHKEKGRLHKSMGMDIVGKRLESLNKILSLKIRLEIIDLKNEDGTAAGTLVKLCVPFKST